MLVSLSNHLRLALIKLEENIKADRSFFIRVPIVFAFLFLWMLRGMVCGLLLVFSPAQISFSHFYAPDPKRGYTKSYTRYKTRQNQIRLCSILTVAAAIFINVIIGTIFSHPQKALAADCSVSTDTTIDSTYISNNSCGTLTISGSPTITWSGTTDFQGAGTVTVNGGGTVTFSGAVVLGSTDDVTITGSTTVRHAPGNITGVNITARNLTIDSGSAINVNGFGCTGGAATSGDGKGPDLLDSDSDGDTQECIATKGGYGDGSGNAPAGGGHGGAGGRGTDVSTGGATYDINTAPTYLGSGGGAGFSNPGAAGGGKIRLDLSGTLTVNGTISANGATGSVTEFSSAGGAGGSVYVTVNGTLNGSGSIAANGGNGTDGSTKDGGGGGGGRIAVYYGTLGTFTLANITATKGTKGGSGQGPSADGENGTTFILDRYTDDGNGDLTITSGLDFTSGLDVARANITVSSGALFSCAAQTTLTISATNNFTDNGSTFSCSNVITTLNITATNTLTTAGATWTISNASAVNISAATWTTSGTNVMSITKAGSVTDWNVTNNLTLNNLTFTGAVAGTGTATNLTMDNAITVSLVNTDIVSNVSWTNLTGLTTDANSSFNTNALGCAGGSSNNQNGYGPDSNGNCAVTTAGYGDGSSFGAGGAGHGGAGGRAKDGPTGATYGSNTAPVLLGSGGGAGWTNYGGYGGGKIRLDVAGIFTHNGTISANGQNGLTNGDANNASGGGSGGSVYISVTTLAGSTGTIDADGGNGGNGNSYDGGGGGGGRISVGYVTDSSSFLVGMTAAASAAAGTMGTGGSNNAADGSAGTLYTLQYSVPTAPTISSPSAGATGVARGSSVTSSNYASDGASHTTTDWQISDDNTFSNSDCSDTNIVYCSLASSNKTSITVNSSNGTFQNGLNGLTSLNGSTTYYVRVRHNNGAGGSSWSSSVTFTTTANAAPSTPINSAPASGATGQSKNPTLTANSFSDSDGDTHASSDWFVYEASDCSGTADWSKSTDSTNKTSIAVNTTNGTFADALSGKTLLKSHTVYSFKVVYRDSGSSASTASSCTSFTTTNTAPALDSNVSDQTFLEDNSSIGAFDLDTYFSDVDFNDDDAYNCTASNDLSVSLGTMTINSNRTVDFTLAANANGTDTVQFSCADGGSLSTSSNTITITITAVNDTPSFTKGSNQTVLEDAGAQSISTWATSLSTGPSNESSQTLSFSVTNDNNSLFSTQPAVSGSNGNLTFTPNSSANGSSTITVILSDNGGTANSGSDTSASQTFTITITAVNDAPSFIKGEDKTALEDAGAQTILTWATIIVAGPSDESSQTLSFALTNDNNSLFSTQPALNSSTGNLTFTPTSNANGSATVTITLSDNGGTANSGSDTSASQTLTITITAVNDTPSFTKGSNQTVLEDAGAQSISTWATSLSTGPSNESSQTLTFTLTNDNNILFSGQPSINSSGQLSFTPTSNANGSATVTISLADNGGTANSGVDASSSQTFTITVTAVNDVPSLTKGSNQTVLEDASAQTVTSWATSISAGPSDESAQTLTFTVTNNNNSLFSTQPALSSSNGNLTYALATNANGSATVTISLADNGGTANSGVDASSSQTFTITVTAVNDAPALSGATDQSVNETGTIELNLTATDTENSTLTFSVVDSEKDFENRGLNLASLFRDRENGTALFQWDTNYDDSGAYTLALQVSDGTAITTTTVTFVVGNIDTRPSFIGNLSSISFLNGTSTTEVFDLDDYFSDADGDTVTYSVSGAISIGVVINLGSVSFSASDDFVGTEVMIFKATDPSGNFSESNSVPVIVNASEISIAEVSHIRGKSKGDGIITVVGNDGITIASWTAFGKGGVVPRIAEVNGEHYIFTVKRRSGSTIHIYTLRGEVVKNRRLSPKLHWRKIAVGNLDDDNESQEIVVSSKRNGSLYLKVFSYYPNKGIFVLRKLSRYGPVRSFNYDISISKKTLHLVGAKGKSRLDWKPF